MTKMMITKKRKKRDIEVFKMFLLQILLLQQLLLMPSLVKYQMRLLLLQHLHLQHLNQLNLLLLYQQQQRLLNLLFSLQHSLQLLRPNLLMMLLLLRLLNQQPQRQQRILLKPLLNQRPPLIHQTAHHRILQTKPIKMLIIRRQPQCQFIHRIILFITLTLRKQQQHSQWRRPHILLAMIQMQSHIQQLNSILSQQLLLQLLHQL